MLSFAFCVSVFPAPDFRSTSHDSEDTKLRFVTCQSLWNQIKSETEVSLVSHTKVVLCTCNNAACFFVSGDLFDMLKSAWQLVKTIGGPEILTGQNIR